MPPWVVPLSIRRVPTDKKKAPDAGAAQETYVLKDHTLSFGTDLAILVGDSSSKARGFLSQAIENRDMVIILGVHGKRPFYRMPEQDD